MSTDRGKLGNFLAEVINWRWDEFVKAETSHEFTGFEATVLALVRTCSEMKLGAIKLAIDRVDGKIETPIKIEYPKIYFTYPFAKSQALEGEEQKTKRISSLKDGAPKQEEKKAEEKKEETLAVLSLRETLQKLADTPRQTVKLILDVKKMVEEAAEAEQDLTEAEQSKVPMVKSVIAANLLKLANEQGNFEAITEVFDQIDGKLVETLRILGDDIFLTQYSEIAPAGAVKNEDGVYQIQAPQAESVWEQKLKDRNGKR